MFSPDIAKYAALCRKAKMKEYRYQQQAYYATLLKEVLVNRQVIQLFLRLCKWYLDVEFMYCDDCWFVQRILEQVYQTGPDAPINFERFQWRPTSSQDRCLEQRVNVKVVEWVSLLCLYNCYFMIDSYILSHWTPFLLWSPIVVSCYQSFSLISLSLRNNFFRALSL